MEWVRSHPYACAIFGASVLVIAGAIIVATHSSLATPTGISAWSGNGGALVNANSPQPIPNTGAQTQSPPPINNSTVDTGILPYTPPAPGGSLSQDNSSSVQIDALLAELSHSSGSAAGQSTNTQTASASGSAAASAYAFIPTGTIAVQDASQEKYTLVQQELYSYGNEAGTYIQSYEERDAGQAQVLINSVQSRNDSTKSAAVAQVGADLIEVGKQLAKISDVPAQAQSDNTALVQSYEATGAALQQVAAATDGSDVSFVAAMQAYDTTANTLVSHYAALALLFSANGVVFGADDPGAEFSFSAGASF